MESKLQRKIILDLKSKGFVVNKVIRCNNSGWPDLEAFRNGEVIFIEVKDENKKADPLQEYVHEILNAQKFKVFVVDTWELYTNLNIK